MNYSEEEWKPVSGYEGYYEVSSAGRVRRVNPRFHITNPSGILTPDHQPGYYPSVTLSVAGRKVTQTCHAMVAAAFIGPRPPGMHVNHIDGDKANPKLENLEYVTPRENDRHARLNGLGGKGNSKLTADEVAEIRRIGRAARRRQLAREYGVSPSAIKKILRRETWKLLEA